MHVTHTTFKTPIALLSAVMYNIKRCLQRIVFIFVFHHIIAVSRQYVMESLLRSRCRVAKKTRIAKEEEDHCMVYTEQLKIQKCPFQIIGVNLL